MGGHNRKVVDCTQQEMLMFHCSVWLRIVLMVQLIVCTVWELNKERHLTAGLMKAPPKRPHCVHCGFSQSGHLCQPLPLASSYLSVCHWYPFSGTLWRENCNCPTMAKRPIAPCWSLEIGSWSRCGRFNFIISPKTVTWDSSRTEKSCLRLHASLEGI